MSKKFILKDLKEKLLESRKEYNAKELIIGRIIYKSNILGEPYRMTQKHIFKEIQKGDITLYQLIPNGSIYGSVEKNTFFGYPIPFVVDKTPFRKVFGNKETITQSKLIKLNSYLYNEEIKEEQEEKKLTKTR